jgi:antitoxin component YwqK of YwqJK toxin-antitoxin module
MDKLDGLCIYNNFGRSSTEYRVEISYKNGIIDGIYKKYYKYKEGSGLHIECNFKEGKYYGIYKEYDKNNNLLIECDYKTYNKEIDIKELM